MQQEPATFTARGAAQHFGLSQDTVRNAIRAGELPAARLGSRRLLILRSDLEAWLHRHAVRPRSGAAQRVAEVIEREARSAG